jgi:hypothetical protein
MTAREQEVAMTLEATLQEGLEALNQDGADIEITELEIDEDGMITGSVRFTGCLCEGQPCFVGY